MCPYIPDNLIYGEMFAAEYTYPAHYVQPPFLNFVRGRDYMHERVASVFTHYDQLSQNLESDSEEIGNLYFNNDGLLSIIQEIYGKE